MRACTGIVLIVGILAVSGIRGVAFAGEADGKPLAATIDAAKKGEPINPFIYGQFIEHLGRCIYGGIWAEMLEDRKFWYPVSDPYDPYGGTPKTAYPVVKASPWEVLGPAGSVTMVKEGSFVGEHTPKVAAGSGLRQRDLGVVAGKAYVGYVWLKAGGKAGPVEVALAWGDGAGDRQAVAIPAVGDAYAKHPLAFKAGATTDQAMLEIRVKGGAVLVGTASLMPADHVGGMRADTLKLLRELDAPMYRWPGGNFVSGYDWRDGIGDRDRRPPRKNPAWTGVEHNDVGIDEFIAFCRAVKAEPVIAVNTGFGDHYSAAQEVEYCNGTAETVGGGWRVKHGHPEPYGVKYWCVGNEMFGPWQLGFMQLRHYTIKHNIVADAMRKADPAVRLLGVGDHSKINRKHDPGEKRGWSRGMLELCADRMEYLSEHFYRGRKPWDPEKPETLVQHVAMLRDSIRQKAAGHRKLLAELPNLKDRPIPIAMDEWNYWHRPYVYGELGCVYDLADGLGVAAGLHEYFRHSDIIHMAHYAQTVNVIGCIKTSRTAASFATTGLSLMLYRRHYGEIPLAVAGEHAPLDVAAALTRDGKTLTLAVVNPLGEAKTLALSFRGVRPAGGGKAWRIAGDDPKAHNVPGEEPAVVIRDVPVGAVDAMTVPKYSVTLAALELAR